ncbi:MAG TPA: DUF6644 family protein [Acetobacteraceae bacterium]|nr:DUF6644 family protein [Acetobacteraceae bacterium]
MDLQPLWDKIELSPIGDFVASSSWAFPTIETLHVISIVTVFGTVAMMDMRLIGLVSRDSRVTELSRDNLTWTWGAFLLAAITGTLLWMSKAHVYMKEPWFYAKMILIGVAGVNMAIFHAVTWRTIGQWDAGPPPKAARIAGFTSLALWVVVVACARMIGFTLGIYE